MCEILTGDPAFTGANADAIHRKAVRGDVGDAVARLANCAVDRELIALAQSCLTALPEERLRHAEGKLREAVVEYREAIRLKPDFAAAHSTLGKALRDHDELVERSVNSARRYGSSPSLPLPTLVSAGCT